MKNELYNDNFQNYKRYNIPKAQLVIADIPYNIGTDFYGSNPTWYINGDRRNGESKKAGKAAFNTDFSFNIAEYFHFCNRLLKKEPKKAIARGRSSDAPCMIVFCAFEQMQTVIKYAEKLGVDVEITTDVRDRAIGYYTDGFWWDSTNGDRIDVIAWKEPSDPWEGER